MLKKSTTQETLIFLILGLVVLVVLLLLVNREIELSKEKSAKQICKDAVYATALSEKIDIFQLEYIYFF